MAAQAPPGFRSDTHIMNELIKLGDVTLEDLKSDWIDLMVKRLFSELNRQLCQVESEKKDAINAADRAENAKVLSSLVGTTERLARLEIKRDGYRKGKNVAKNADARRALERKLDKLARTQRKSTRAGRLGRK